MAVVGAVVGFEFGGRLSAGGSGRLVEAAIGERAAQGVWENGRGADAAETLWGETMAVQ